MLQKISILLFSYFIFNSVDAQIQIGQPLLGQSSIRGTLQIKFNGGTGTAFQYKGKDSRSYLITAKHIFKKRFKRSLNSGNKLKYFYYDSLAFTDGNRVDLQIYYSGDWHNINANLYFDSDKYDVAVLQTEIPMQGNNYNLTAEGNEVVIGQDCYFIGYPLGLRSSLTISLYPMPFIRKGIISAMGSPGEKFPHTIYIDGHNTYGFSGGPLLYYDINKRAFTVLGVISSYLPQRNHHYKDDGTDEITEENSGIMEVCNIECVKDILKRLAAL